MSTNNIVKNWIALAEYDLKTAKAMFDTERYLYVAFMCQQAVEKILKACYVKQLDETPPYTHNLLRLAKQLSFFPEIGSDHLKNIELLNSYYVESRYTEEFEELSRTLTKDKAKTLLVSTGELFEWFKCRI
ncbi:MAG: HEPN domain-containing protein [Actinobacteria bacterium]|nr:HEPN domain-containing protein [Actinomycetota bacterium]